MVNCKYCGVRIRNGFYCESSGNWYCSWACLSAEADKVLREYLNDDYIFWTTTADSDTEGDETE